MLLSFLISTSCISFIVEITGFVLTDNTKRGITCRNLTVFAPKKCKSWSDFGCKYLKVSLGKLTQQCEEDTIELLQSCKDANTDDLIGTLDVEEMESSTYGALLEGHMGSVGIVLGLMKMLETRVVQMSIRCQKTHEV